MKRFIVLGCLALGAMGTLLADVGRAETAKGDQMVVAARNAPLMRGSSTLATLHAGQRFQVIRTEGKWVGTRVKVGGKEVSGWLWRGQVATPQQFAQGRQAVRRYSYQPVVPGANPYATNTLPPDMGDYYTGGVRSNSPLIMGATPYGQSYWRGDRKIIGY